MFTGIRGANAYAAALLRFSRFSTDLSVRILRGLAWPKVELVTRLWLAQIYFVSGVLKLTHWDTALYLATHEYPVSWASAGSAAAIGASIEVIGGALLAAGFMTAGVTASPAANWLSAAADNAGRVKVAADLSVPGYPNVYAIGDTAASEAWKGQSVPGLAPAAKQGGVYVARQIRAKLEGRAPPPAFAYRHLGSLATIGRKAAVADFGFIKLWGAPAWWLWGMVHIGLLIGIRNRVATMVNWFWAYLTFRGGIRLITGGDAAYEAPLAAPRHDMRQQVEPL
jgi:hypothetical protein